MDKKETHLPLTVKEVEQDEVPELPKGVSEKQPWKVALYWFLTLISILSLSVPVIFVLKGLGYLALSDTTLGAYGAVILGGQGLLALAAKYILAPFLTMRI